MNLFALQTVPLFQPDIVRYQPQRHGPCSITAIGDVKGRTSDDAFPNSEIGHVLDMATVAERTPIPSSLHILSLIRWISLKCQRQSGGVSEPLKYLQSAIYIGEAGWQVCTFPFPQFTPK
jgi:hypothetical protein